MGERTGNVMLSLGVVLWFASTWYFGWNWTAKSHAEEVCDTVSDSLILFGFVIHAERLASRLSRYLRSKGF